MCVLQHIGEVCSVLHSILGMKEQDVIICCPLTTWDCEAEPALQSSSWGLWMGPKTCSESATPCVNYLLICWLTYSFSQYLPSISKYRWGGGASHSIIGEIRPLGSLERRCIGYRQVYRIARASEAALGLNSSPATYQSCGQNVLPLSVVWDFVVRVKRLCT